MFLSLNKAAKQSNVAKTTLQRALESGELSAKKNDKGHWQIDPAELGRWIDNRPTEQTKTGPKNQTGTHYGTTEKPSETSVLSVELEVLRQRMADKDDVIADLRAERDEWRKQAQQLAITDQREKRSFWKRVFSSGG